MTGSRANGDRRVQLPDCPLPFATSPQNPICVAKESSSLDWCGLEVLSLKAESRAYLLIVVGNINFVARFGFLGTVPDGYF